MAKGKGGKAREESRLRRHIDERKRRKHLGRLVDEILYGATRWLDDAAAAEGSDDDGPDDDHDDDVTFDTDGTMTVTGRIVEDPDDPGRAASLARLSDAIDAAGGELTLGPGQFSVGPDDGYDDEEDEGAYVDEALFDDPMFDDAVIAAFPKLAKLLGDLTVEYLGDLLDSACVATPCVRDGRLVEADLDGEVPEGAVGHDCEVFAIPVAGPSGEVARVLADLQSGTALGDRLEACGVVGRGARVVVVPGVVPLSELCVQTFEVVRAVGSAGCAAALGLRHDDGEPIDHEATSAMLREPLGVVPLADVATHSAEGFFAGALVAVRVVPFRDGIAPDWLFTGEPDPDGTDPGDAWLGWTREHHASSGVSFSVPMGLGRAPAEAAQMLVEGYFDRQARAQGVRPGATPDRTVASRGDASFSVFAWHDAPGVLVGPLVVPTAAVLRDLEGFVEAVEDLADVDFEILDDPDGFRAALEGCRRSHDEARAREADAAARDRTEEAPPVAEAAPSPAPEPRTTSAAFPSGDVIPFRPRR